MRGFLLHFYILVWPGQRDVCPMFQTWTKDKSNLPQYSHTSINPADTFWHSTQKLATSFYKDCKKYTEGHWHTHLPNFLWLPKEVLPNKGLIHFDNVMATATDTQSKVGWSLTTVFYPVCFSLECNQLCWLSNHAWWEDSPSTQRNTHVTSSGMPAWHILVKPPKEPRLLMCL